MRFAPYFKTNLLSERFPLDSTVTKYIPLGYCPTLNVWMDELDSKYRMRLPEIAYIP